MGRLTRLRLTSDTVGPVARGHPWVYQSGLAEPEACPAPGTPVQLLDGRDRPVGFGLVDEGDIRVRVLSRHPEPLGRLVPSRIAAAAQLRASLLRPDTSAFRLVNGAGDGLPGLVVDRYGPLPVVRLYGACWVPHRARLTAALQALEGVDHVVRRLGVRRVDGAGGLEVWAGPPPPETLVIQEAGLRFLVRPGAGQKTGLFLDQREHRIFLGARARDLEVVNLFSYTGGFSVHAAAAGARRVISVDLAPEVMDDARENFRLNGLDPDAHGFEVADAFAWAADTPADLLICDPPSLTHGRKADRAARKAYRDLAARVGAHVRPGGLLATSSCTARLSHAAWRQAVGDGLRHCGRWAWLWEARHPPDHPVALGHPEGHYLKFGLLHRRAPSSRQR